MANPTALPHTSVCGSGSAGGATSHGAENTRAISQRWLRRVSQMEVPKQCRASHIAHAGQAVPQLYHTSKLRTSRYGKTKSGENFNVITTMELQSLICFTACSYIVRVSLLRLLLKIETTTSSTDDVERLQTTIMCVCLLYDIIEKSLTN